MDLQPEHDSLDGVPPPAATFHLVGHGPAFDAVLDARDRDRMHHAWLLQGAKGIGKATTSFAIARHLIGGDAAVRSRTHDCLNFDETNTVVRQIALGSHPNLLHISRGMNERGTGFRTQVTVDDIRRLTHFFQSTTGAGWRIAIIDPIDDLNRNASNALLKLLEEPPARSLFFLVNHMPGRLLPTIRSRCRVLRFADLREVDVASEVAIRFPDTSPEDTSAIARQANGSLRDAFILAGGGGLEIGQHVDRLFSSERTDWNAIHSSLDLLTQKGREAAWELFANGLLLRLGEESKHQIHAGNVPAAERLARLWLQETARWREAAAYNLDRKQMILTFFEKLEQVRHGREG